MDEQPPTSDYGYDTCFVEFADTSRGLIVSTKAEFEDLAQSAPDLLSESEKKLFARSAYDARNAIEELIKIIDKVERPIDRGDVYFNIRELVASAFAVGLEIGATEKSRKRAGQAMQSLRGKASGTARRAKQDRWHAYVYQRVSEILGGRPTIKPGDLVDVIRKHWNLSNQDTPSTETLTPVVRQIRKNLGSNGLKT